MRTPKSTSEDGSVLIIVLTFMLVVSLLTTAALRLTVANLTLARSSRIAQQRLAAANAGVDFGISYLLSVPRSNSANPNVSTPGWGLYGPVGSPGLAICPTTGSKPLAKQPPKVNGWAVQVGCETLDIDPLTEIDTTVIPQTNPPTRLPPTSCVDLGRPDARLPGANGYYSGLVEITSSTVDTEYNPVISVAVICLGDNDLPRTLRRINSWSIT